MIPLFMFVITAFLQIGFIMVTNVRIALAFSSAVEETAQEAYSYEVGLGEGSKVFITAALYGKLQKNLNKDGLVKQYVTGGEKGVLLTEGYLTEDGFVEASIRYIVSIQVPLLQHLHTVFTEHRIQKAYIGSVSSTEENTYVYITDNQSVYHVTRTCSHLNLCIYEISVQQLQSEYKNLAPCHNCKNAGNKLYVTAEGDCYHTSLACPGLTRRIYRVKKSSVPELDACSRCGG